MFPHKFALATAYLGPPLSTAALLSTFVDSNDSNDSLFRSAFGEAPKPPRPA